MRTVAEFTVREGQTRALLAHLLPLARAGAPARRRLLRRRGDHSLVAVVGVARQLRAARVARRRRALAHHLEGAHLRPDGWHHRRPDDVAARGARRRAQLGLPLLLAARRHAHAFGPDGGRVPRGGGGVARLAAQGRGRGPLQAADHVRPRRRAEPAGVRGRLAAGLRGVAPRAHRQRRSRPVPARRLRRGARRPARGAAHRPRPLPGRRGISRSC